MTTKRKKMCVRQKKKNRKKKKIGHKKGAHSSKVRKKSKTFRLKEKSVTKHKATQKEGSRRNEYFLNPDFEFYGELRDLILKSSPTEKRELTKRIQNLGRIKFAVISGIFLQKENPDPQAADLLIVCDDINKNKFRTMLKSLEAEVGKELKYALMDKDEFMYRLNMFDRFMRVIFEGSHEVLIDKIGIDL